MQQPLTIRGLGELYLDAKGEVRGHGRKFFYWQVMGEDASDNYAANSASDMIWGGKSAYKLLQPCQNDVECWQALVDGYRNLYPEKKIVKGWRGDDIEIDWLYMLQENVDLAHMKRTVDDALNVSALLTKLKISH
jgi:hypothetical protein